MSQCSWSTVQHVPQFLGHGFVMLEKKCNFFIPKLFLTNTTAYITEHTQLLQGMLVCIVCLCLEQKVFFNFLNKDSAVWNTCGHVHRWEENCATRQLSTGSSFKISHPNSIIQIFTDLLLI